MALNPYSFHPESTPERSGVSASASGGVAPAQPQQQDFVKLFLQALQQHQGAQDRNSASQLGLERDKTFGAHRDIGGNVQGDYSNSPWGGPLKFESAGDRLQKMQGYGPAVGIPPRTDMESNPYAFGALGPAVPDATIPQAPMAPTIPLPGGGIQGMVNPMLPDAQKYQDPNMFKVRPRTALPPGAIAGDGVTNYGRAGSSFMF